jgi:2-polyprenyl-6-methoxyphenol hydroxylase-like FAD-dependent oxidoreductase
MDADVVIAGAGPNGMLLACELALAGVRPVVLERLPERSDMPKANGLIGQVAKFLDQRGLYQRFTSAEVVPQPAPLFMFAALPLKLSILDDNPMYGIMIPQRRLEALLEERTAELGVPIHRGHELVSFTQDEDGVRIRVATASGEYEITAAYLVGCDGGRSQVRKHAGIRFPGKTSTNVVSRTGHVSLPEELLHHDTAELEIPGLGRIPAGHNRTERGVFVCAVLEPGRPLVGTVEWGGAEPGEDEPMTIDELRASASQVLGAQVPLGPPTSTPPNLLRRLTGQNTRLAEQYRSGRVFLAGDAAHTHSAVGGPGLNLGMQDVANLGWKLAATVRGWAPEGLLDSYATERRPVAERVVMHTMAQTALLSPGAEVTALRQLFGELLAKQDNVQHIADLMSGSDIRYPADAAHPLAGRFAPDVEVATEGGTRRLAELMREARPVLLDLGDGEHAEAARGWRDRITVHTGQSSEPPAGALLIRPDGHVAWACQPGDSDHDGLRAALHTWFGIPARDTDELLTG